MKFIKINFRKIKFEFNLRQSVLNTKNKMVEIVKRKVRHNGFDCPLHPSQVFSYLLFISDIVSFYMVDLVSLHHLSPLVITLGVIYLILACGTAYYGYLSTRINPQDPTINLERRCKQKSIPFDASYYEYHCQICEAHVLLGSKHCGQCNRCTSGFDHHCRYLNNCIGEQNYEYFFKLIIWVFWMCLLHNVTNAIVIYNIASENEYLISNHVRIYKTELTTPFQTTLIVMIILNTLALLFLGQLIVFHVELKYKGLTTYEFLKLKENSTKESKIVVRVNHD